MKRMVIIVVAASVLCAGCTTAMLPRTAGGMVAKDAAKKVIHKHKLKDEATSRPATE